MKSNVFFTCRDCSVKTYPRKGKFSRSEIMLASHVKARFSDGGYGEHMWIKVTKVEENEVIGTLDNKPVIVISPRYGDSVAVPFSEIKDIQFK